MLSAIKEKFLFKLAKVTQRYQPHRYYNLLLKAYSPHKRQNDHIEALMPYDGDLFMRISTASWIEWHLFFWGGYERMTRQALKTFLKPGFVVFDIGANVGVHALVMAKAVTQTGKVYCFEPHPVMCSKLQENVSINSFKNVEIYRLAISNQKGQATLYGYDEKRSNQGISTLVKEFVASPDSPEIVVPTMTLDEFVEREKVDRLDLIKIDVEGAETQIFEGAYKSLEKYRPIIILEYVRVVDKNLEFSNHIRRFVKENDYRIYLIKDENRFLLDEIVGDFPQENVLQLIMVPQVTYKM